MIETLFAIWIYHRHGMRSVLAFCLTVAALQFLDGLVTRYTGASMVQWALFRVPE